MKFCKLWLSIIMTVVILLTTINMNTAVSLAMENEEAILVDEGEESIHTMDSECVIEGDMHGSDENISNEVTNERDDASEELVNGSDSTLPQEDNDQGNSVFVDYEASLTINDITEDVIEVKEESRAPEYLGQVNEVTTAGEDLMQMDIVAIDGNTYDAIYAHLSGVNVSVGQHVTLETVIGALGNTGCSTGAHLHIELRDEYSNNTTWHLPTYPGYSEEQIASTVCSRDSNKEENE